MTTKSARANLVRLLRTTLLVNAAAAGRMADRFLLPGVPLHEATLNVEHFHADDASGFCVVRVGDEVVGNLSALPGELSRWLASPAGAERIALKEAEDAAERALQRTGTVVWIMESDRWPGTAEVVLEDRSAFPLIPLTNETAADVRHVHADLVPGTRVRMRIVPAAEIVDDYARILDPAQPCIDWIMRDREAA